MSHLYTATHNYTHTNVTPVHLCENYTCTHL